MPRCRECGKVISKEESEKYNNLCPECYDDLEDDFDLWSFSISHV